MERCETRRSAACKTKKKKRKRMVTCAAAIAPAGMLPSRGGGGRHTEMDWMRLKAEVLAGMMTPVRLLDLATGLTLLLQGS